MTSKVMDWSAKLREFRSRNNLKQEATAEIIGVSQTYVSRLEAGLIKPSGAVRERLIKLLASRENRPMLDYWKAVAKSSPFPVALLKETRGQVEVVEISPAIHDLGEPFTKIEPGTFLEKVLDEEALKNITGLIEQGLFDGSIGAMDGVWRMSQGRKKSYCILLVCRSVTTLACGMYSQPPDPSAQVS